ncbi:MAG: hypothetical protein U9R27_06710 [Campylobacterota bacterium]|nr:hypothetical protein [Campylobacterota bacterium]
MLFREIFHIPLEKYNSFEKDLHSLGIEYIPNGSFEKEHSDDEYSILRYKNNTYQMEDLYSNEKMNTMDGSINWLSEECIKDTEEFMEIFYTVATKYDSGIYIDPRIEDIDMFELKPQ